MIVRVIPGHWVCLVTKSLFIINIVTVYASTEIYSERKITYMYGKSRTFEKDRK